MKKKSDENQVFAIFVYFELIFITNKAGKIQTGENHNYQGLSKKTYFELTLDINWYVIQ